MFSTDYQLTDNRITPLVSLYVKSKLKPQETTFTSPFKDQVWCKRVQAAIPTTAVPTTAVPTAAIPTTIVPTTASKPHQTQLLKEKGWRNSERRVN